MHRCQWGSCTLPGSYSVTSTWDEMKVTVHLCEIHYGAYLNDGDETMLRDFTKDWYEAESGGDAA